MQGVLAEVTRGGRVESFHIGRAVVTDGRGEVVWSCGDVVSPVFPRSTVKALLALPLVESGAAARLGLTDAELALACASHGGEPLHAETASNMLERVGRDVDCLECGTHWPTYTEAAYDLAARHARPSALHNNCSGKHAGLICLACDQGIDPQGYVQPFHPVQRQVTEALEILTGAPHTADYRGVDGCSMPTYAIPLKALARGFARFGSGEGLSGGQNDAARQLREAVAAKPFMVAGSGRFDTRLMNHFGTRVFCKMGAEGMMVASVPQLGLGIAIKTDDGANRAAEVALAALLQRFGHAIWSDSDRILLEELAQQPLRNWNGIDVGAVRAAKELT
ncbi:asparaginase [Kozakia baliensis]|uniref:Asparaginase n=1 Tax=Kozakia baliensis TaxID=153496 RepID=A0A1D8UXI0_9PROT|nr:asparaginase [Kozakia baliensis]AOX18365.1 asparaginase [Kozakia baliensis]